MINWLKKRLIEGEITREEIKLRALQRVEEADKEKARRVQEHKQKQLEILREIVEPLSDCASILDIPIGVLGALNSAVIRCDTFYTHDGVVTFERNFDENLTIRQILEENTND